MPYWLIIEKIDILQHGERRNLSSHPCKETIKLLCIIAYHHEIIIQLREYRLDSLSETFVDPCGWIPVLLVQPVRDIEGDVGSLKQVQLYRSTQVAPRKNMTDVRPSHLAPVGSYIPTDLHGLGVNAENRLATVYNFGYLWLGGYSHLASSSSYDAGCTDDV